MMMAPETIDSVCQVLDEEDFSQPDHRLIWHAIVNLGNKGMPVDAITLGEWLKANDLDEMIGGTAFLAEICNNTPSPSNIHAYVAIVRGKSLLRQLMSMAEATLNECQTTTITAKQALAHIETRLFDVTDNATRDRDKDMSMRSASQDAFRKLTERYQHGGGLLGMSTGLDALDEAIGGLCPGELILLAARDGMGKTTLAMNICEHVALTKKQPVLFFSLRHDASELASRMIASTGIIDHSRIHRGLLDDNDWSRFSHAMGLLCGSKIIVDDSSDVSAARLAHRARRVHREQAGLDLIILDDLQAVYAAAEGERQATLLRALCRTLKTLAKELHVPVVALSQLDHAVDLRPNKRPVLSDLSVHGAIQSYADQVLFLYRDELYHNLSTDKGIVEVIIGKQRNGPAGIVRLRFLEQRLRFENEDQRPSKKQLRN